MMGFASRSTHPTRCAISERSKPTRRQGFDEAHDGVPDIRVFEAQERAGQRVPFGFHQKISDMIRRRFGVFLRSNARRWQALEEERYRDTQHGRELVKPPGADAIGPFLVFLDLLERDAEPVGDILLTHAERKPAHANALADMLVRRVGMPWAH
jgi:hypothetical protein